MPLMNAPTRYGTVSRFLHWTVFLLIVYQFIGANIMTRLGRNATVLGLNQDFFYNWHKSLGLVVLLVALARVIWRRTTPLPNWADALTPVERAITSRLETLLYALMFLLPVTGFLFVMAGGYGVKLFGAYDLPNPIGKHETLAWWAQLCHLLLTYSAVVVISWHVGLGLKKHIYDRARFFHRMLPFGGD